MKVAIYTRVSTDHQIDKDSLPMQRRDLIAYTQLVIGTEDYEIFEDAGYSGKNIARPGFQAMMSRIRNGEFTHVLVWKIDRISRNLLDFAQMYAELKKLGVAFVSKNEQFDTSSAMGEAMLKIILVFAELERNMTSERVTATMISRASKGVWNGGRIPYGYSYDSATKTFSIDPNEAEIVHFMHDRYEQLHSLVRLANELTNKGSRTRNGILWSPTALNCILSSNFYCGDYQYNVHAETNHTKIKPESEWVYIKDHHPAIITREQKSRINDMLAFNDRGKKTGRRGYVTSYSHIFGGILHCHTCGRLLHSSVSHNAAGLKITNYICPTKRSNSSACSQKAVRDFTIGDFLFNYLVNMMRVRNSYKLFKDPTTVEQELLSGWPFRDVKHLSRESLLALYDLLASGSDKELYLSSVKPSSGGDSSLAVLQNKKDRQERALQRLTDLYLYSESNMSEREFVVRKTAIEGELASLNEQIENMAADGFTQDDTNFIDTASKFIIAQELGHNDHVSFKTIMENVDHEILRDFVHRIVSSIIVNGDHIEEIQFRSGLVQTFEYENKSL
jgi:site-specific DNA recombinase